MGRPVWFNEPTVLFIFLSPPNGPRRSRRVTPMMMPHPCPSASRLLRPFFKSHNFFIMEKWPVSEKFYVKVESLKFQQFYLMKFDFFQSFNFDLKFVPI